MRAFWALGAATTLLAAACSGGATGGGNVQSVDTALGEWTVTPAVTTVKAGKITFVAKNNGKEGHELELSNREGREIPDSASLGEAEDIAPGETKSFTLDLKPGTYELACRIQNNQAAPPFNHYDKGMHVRFVVQ